MEIERKFLVNDDTYKTLAFARSEILQAYVCRQQGRTVRIRLRDDKAFLTIKGPSDESGIARFEWEKEIPAEEARQLLDICLPGHIRKTRWLVQSGRHIVEVDEFHDDNDGLVFAEIELGTVDEAYEKPSFLGREVTGDRRYYNGFISRNPYCTWEDK